MSDANFTPNLGEYKSLQPFRFWCQKVLPLVYDDSLSYYELLCKVVDYLNKTMEDVETLHGDVTNLHKAYAELQGYVNNYFNNLDIQNEINNKLDELVKSGKFDTILDNYFQKKCNTYKTAIDMINDASLTEGCFCVTQGYYAQGDAGSAMYYITNSPDSEILCVELENKLYARLCFNDYTVNVCGLGVKGSDDIGALINKLLTVKAFKWHTIYLPYGTYTQNTPIISDNVTNFKILGDYGSTVINATSDIFRLYGASYSEIENIIFNGNGENIGWSLSDKHHDTQQDRSSFTKITNCTFSNFKVSITIDAPSGYNHFNNVNITKIPENGIGIRIGEFYSNTAGILPNYIYFNDCNIDAKDSPYSTIYGVKISCGQYIKFTKCDIANFKNSTALIIDNEVDTITNIIFENTEFFNNKNHADIRRSTLKILTNINFNICTFSSYIANANGIICKPEHYINSFNVNCCTFIGDESSWNMMLDFNSYVILNINTSTNISNPFKHTNLPPIDNIIASPKWLYGKTTTTLGVAVDGSTTLTVGSNNGWRAITEATPITTYHNYDISDVCSFGEIVENKNNNTKTCVCYTPATNKHEILASLSIL